MQSEGDHKQMVDACYLLFLEQKTLLFSKQKDPCSDGATFWER